MIKVLIVDDAAFMRMTIKMMLEKNGFEIVGEAAVQKYQKCHPDIVTMDITMPEMNGIESLKLKLKNDPKAKDVMISAMDKNVW